MKIGFTGTQRGMTDKQKGVVSAFVRKFDFKVKEFHHGDCIGADSDFHKIVNDTISDIIIHPPKNKIKRAFCNGDVILECKEYLDRNKDIVDSTDMLIVTPGEDTEVLRSGTWSTFRYGKKKKKPIFLVYPDGKIYRIIKY